MEEPDRGSSNGVYIEVPLMETITGKRFPGATSLQTQVIADRKLEEKRVDLKIDCYKKVDFDALVVDLSAQNSGNQ